MIRLEPRAHDYDERHWLSVKGTGDLGDGQMVKLNLGESITCGRSRWCEWSLKRSPAFLTVGDGERREVLRSLGWRAVSRRHCRLNYVAPDMVEVENLSPNGTLVDGHRVDRIVLTDCRQRAHTIQLGPHGVLLELGPGALPL